MEVSPKFVPSPEDLTKVNLNQVEKELEISEDFGKLKSGSLFKYARLKNESPKNVLIFCHGYRPVGIPLAAPYAANDNPHLSVCLFLFFWISFNKKGFSFFFLIFITVYLIML